MADREFDTDAEREAYAAGMEEAAKKLQKPPLTIDDVRNMSVAEVMARKTEVHEAIRRGKVSGEGSGDDASD